MDAFLSEFGLVDVLCPVKRNVLVNLLSCLSRPGQSKFRETWLQDILASKAAVLEPIQV